MTGIGLAHYLTVATFTLPDGEPIEGRGIRPDLEVPSDSALAAPEGQGP